MFSGVPSEGSLPGRFPFCGRRCFSAVSHPQQYSIATRDTVVPMNIEVPTTYPLSHNDRIVVLEICLHSESPMFYRTALHGNWNALSLARRALKDKFHTPMIPLTAVLPNRQVFLPDPVYLSVPSKLMHKPNHIIYHLIPMSYFPQFLFVPTHTAQCIYIF